MPWRCLYVLRRGRLSPRTCPASGHTWLPWWTWSHCRRGRSGQCRLGWEISACSQDKAHKNNKYRVVYEVVLEVLTTWVLSFSRSILQGGDGGRALGLVIPLPDQLCLGRWEFGWIDCAGGQRGGKLKLKPTQTTSTTTSSTLHTVKELLL